MIRIFVKNQLHYRNQRWWWSLTQQNQQQHHQPQHLMAPSSSYQHLTSSSAGATTKTTAFSLNHAYCYGGNDNEISLLPPTTMKVTPTIWSSFQSFSLLSLPTSSSSSLSSRSFVMSSVIGAWMILSEISLLTHKRPRPIEERKEYYIVNHASVDVQELNAAVTDDNDDIHSENIWYMSSTLKKRRAKMNKHKLRKRRKLLRRKNK